MTELTWTGLSPAQADGQACVICGHAFGLRGSVCVPVGRSSTGSQVFACVDGCGERAGQAAGLVLPVPDEALTAAGVACLAALDRAGGDLRQAYPDGRVVATVRAAAPLIVAAALRRLAAEMDPAIGRPGLPDTAMSRYLRVRADELDPDGEQQP
ncbi:MAG: hypothetical protein ABR608_07590 [Pseudonocardiaceae bacterium]